MAFSRCWTGPEGPADVPFGKDLRMGRMAKAGLSVMGSEVHLELLEVDRKGP